MRATQVLIDLQALQHNLSRVRKAAPSSRVMAAIKANGYGHGLVRVARALADADGFCVAGISEAIALRDSGIEHPIVLLEGFFDADELSLIARYRLETMVHHLNQIEVLERVKLTEPVDAWLKIDTGMHRLGFAPLQARAMWQRLEACPAVGRLRGSMTHLANADDLSDPYTLHQLDSFESVVSELPGERAIANSAGILGWPRSHGDWVRPGIMLYGVSPFIGGRAESEGLRPVMTLRSEIIAVNHFQTGDAIGYGGTWVCPEAMPVGVVAIGYGDGYPRHAAHGTPVLVNGQRVPMVGRVSMDMITVDLRTQPQARVGDPVVLWGGELPVEEIAEHSATIAYELLSGVTSRVEYLEIGG